MILFIICLPLLNFILCCVMGVAKHANIFGLKILTWCNLIISIIFILFIYLNLINSEDTLLINITPILSFKLGIISINASILISKTSIVMLLLVTTVSQLVNLFSLWYMEGEPHINRFMGYLSLFAFFMNVLITSENLLQLFLGWEGVGISSYLLVSFWLTREKAVRSGFKAMLVNKVGDMSFIIAMGITLQTYGTLSITTISSLAYNHNNLNTVICFFFLIAVCGKSAQIGLHTWLPAAMEGPTPVSALIHAATMVTAGVYLIVKLSPLFITSYIICQFIGILGGVTALISASIGCLQSDIKKVIAYSTCSQLGYMVLICGYGYFNLGLTHLFNHGMFKALLFLSAGVIIHALGIHQSLTRMGLKQNSPLANMSIVIGSLAICGFPFLTGFYSKDLLLEAILSSNGQTFPILCAYLAAAITCFYSIRVHYLAFRIENISYHTRAKYSTKINLEIGPIIVLSLLACASIILGYLNSITVISLIKPIIVSNLGKFIPILESIIILLSCQFIVYKHKSLLNHTYIFLINKYWFDSVYARLFKYSGKKSMYIYKFIDNNILEWFSSSGIAFLFKNISGLFSYHLTERNITTIWNKFVDILCLSVFIFYFIFYFISVCYIPYLILFIN